MVLLVAERAHQPGCKRQINLMRSSASTPAPFAQCGTMLAAPRLAAQTPAVVAAVAVAALTGKWACRRDS